jgi:cytochrome c1
MPQFDERSDEEIRDLQQYIEQVSRAAASSTR